MRWDPEVTGVGPAPRVNRVRRCHLAERPSRLQLQRGHAISSESWHWATAAPDHLGAILCPLQLKK